MELSEIYKYFHHIENIISLELSVSKFIFAAADVIEMDSCIQSGMPFFQTHADVLGSVTHDLAAIINSGKAAPDIGLTETGKTLKEREGRLAQTQNELAQAQSAASDAAASGLAGRCGAWGGIWCSGGRCASAGS